MLYTSDIERLKLVYYNDNSQDFLVNFHQNFYYLFDSEKKALDFWRQNCNCDLMPLIAKLNKLLLED